MANPTNRVATAETEAAAWHARLGAPSVNAETLEQFFRWREAPANADAYRRVEATWIKAGPLARDPEIAATLDEILSRPRRASSARPVRQGLIAFAAVGAATALAIGGWTWMQTRNVFSTAVGEQRVVQLADGSSVRLDTGSRIRVRFEDDRRGIDLVRGQAMFTVAHDASRPFVVAAGAARVTAVGTVFDVRRDGPAVRVTLVSGAVDVAAAADTTPARLSAGHQASVTTRAVRTRAVDAVAETSWTEGRIVFRDTPLASAVAEVNRYLTDPVVLDTGADAILINGVFRAGDRDAFVSAASEGLGLRASERGDGAIVLMERTNN